MRGIAAVAAVLRSGRPGDAGTWTSGVVAPGGSAPAGDERFRAGSVTKTLVATVVLQLVDEGRERHLSGVVPDGDRITVRQVLNHTSGLHDYMKADGMSTNRWRGEDRFTSWTPDQLLAEAFAHAPYFPPGTGFRYSSTNYVVAGLLVEHLTGAPYAAEVERRILRPLHLDGTSFPGTDPAIPEPALHAQADVGGGDQPVDVTEQDESLDWAAGETVTTGADLDTFLDALLGGDLLSDDALAEMRTTVPVGLGFHYGLGLQRFDLPCGGQVWGHGGQLLGYVTYAYRRDDGRSLQLALVSGDDDGFGAFLAAATATFCLA